MAIFDPRDPGLEQAFHAARQSRFDPLSEALGIVQRLPGMVSKTRELKEEKARRKALSEIAGGFPAQSADEALALEKIRSSREQGGPLDLETSNGIRALVGLPASNEPLSRQEARLLTQARAAKGQPRHKSKAEVEKETMEALMRNAKSERTESPLDKVKVVHPDGRTGTIPRAQLKAAQSRGFQIAQ